MTEISSFAWLAAPGEELCLDFANTKFWRGQAQPTETLPDLAALLAWCGDKGQVPRSVLEPIAARGNPAEAAALYAGARALREAIYRLFHALGAGGPPPQDDLALLNSALARVPSRQHVGSAETGFGWRIDRVQPSAIALLTPVLWSAGDLLVSRRLARVRSCANDQCQWLFLDDSKSGNRRWCSMSACGNRAKAHRHYLKTKGGG